MTNKIKLKNSSWTFGRKVPKSFEKHIAKSVPFYNEGHKVITNLSDFFLKDGSTFYDLGCSTGNLIKKISLRHSNKKINFIGIDSVKEMINQANLNKKEIRSNLKCKILFKKADIQKCKLKKNDMFISYYTIQFLPPKIRQKVVDKIYKSLNWGGAFIMCEKIRGPDARFQDILTLMYNEFKLDNNFTSEEILQKSRSLKGVLEPFSDKGNLDMLKRSGFKDIFPIFQMLSFKGYLCIK
tara:strand:+ start:107 stop:823 length:717 start_codon:yes stop_codon:yes gene_type:complete